MFILIFYLYALFVINEVGNVIFEYVVYLISEIIEGNSLGLIFDFGMAIVIVFVKPLAHVFS